jgi:S1-C subfamily serine protease
MTDGVTWVYDNARTNLGFMLARASTDVLVEIVFPASRARMAGLNVSDVICGINGSTVSTIDDFAYALGGIDTTQSFTVDISRAGMESTLEFPSSTAFRQDLTNNLAAEQRAEGPANRRSDVVLASCQFANSDRSSGEGFLRATDDGLEFVAHNGDRNLVSWNEIVDIQVATTATSRVTITRVLLIGLFALAAQKKQVFTVLEVETSYTTFAFVTTESQARVVEIVKPLVVRLHDARPDSRSAHAIAGEVINAESSSLTRDRPLAEIPRQIRELADLRDEGLITDEEFTLAKGKILGS